MNTLANQKRSQAMKGNSNNPTGRPPVTQADYDLKALCKSKSPEAVDTILALMKSSDKDSTKLNAAIYIIERGFGKPVQDIDVQGKLEISQIIRKIVDPKA